MTVRTLVLLAAAGSAVWASEPSAWTPSAPVPVCVGQGDSSTIGSAKTLTARMFASIGVPIDWREWPDCPADAIQISLSHTTASSQRPGALAYAFPYEGIHIVIFYDRVAESVEPRKVPALTAHVIAHEVGHILEGVNRHSESGVMKAHWDAIDLREMSWRALPFDPEDVFLIHQGLESRSVHLAGAR